MQGQPYRESPEHPAVTLLALACSLVAGIFAAHFDQFLVLALTITAATIVALTRPAWRAYLVACTLWLIIGFARVDRPIEIDRQQYPLCRVEGIVREHQIVRVPPSQTRFGVAADYTRATIAIESCNVAPLIGHQVDLYVSGHATQLETGIRTTFIASVEQRPPPDNPGQRIRPDQDPYFLRVGHPDAIKVQPATRWHQWRNHVRKGLTALLHDRLSQQSAGVAETLLLGIRERLDEQTSEAFRLTGTGHLLAISGLHLGLVAWLVAGLARRLTVSVRRQTLIVCGLVILYALLVEPRASVIRATVFALLGGVAVTRGRTIASVSLWSAALLVVLLIDPMQLFSAGAQLSFAAVLAIVGIVKFEVIERLTPTWFEFDEMTSHRWLRARLLPIYKLILWGVLLWAATAPLAAYHFRWVTVWGALLHVVCFPLVTIAMGTSLSAIAIDLWLPVAKPLWLVSDWSLRLLIGVVETAASTDGLSYAVGAPDGLWTAGLYIVLLLLIACRSWFWQKRFALAGVAWAGLGLLLSVWPHHANTLRVTTLSVGHGLCVAIQTPDRHNLLYDAGSLSNAQRTGSEVVDALRAMHVNSIDAVILSHTDSDHFSLLPVIAEQLPIQKLWCHNTLTATQSASAVFALESPSVQHIPRQTLSRGNTINFGDVEFEILHPGPDDDFERDNEDSLVVRLSFAGRQILLTGDIEHAGQDALFSTPFATQPNTRCDILLSPHHGSRVSNTASLNTWANPTHVISSSRQSSHEHLQTTYPQASIWETAKDGAVFVEVNRKGDVSVQSFIKRTPLE